MIRFLLLFIIIFSFFYSKCQERNFSLLKKFNQSSTRIKSGSYSVLKLKKFFDGDEIVKEFFNIKFFQKSFLFFFFKMKV